MQNVIIFFMRSNNAAITLLLQNTYLMNKVISNIFQNLYFI